MASSSLSKKSIHLSNDIDDPDRISHMPDNVISNILSLLPTKNQVVTSCVSARLRPFRASITNLDFDDEYYPHQTWSAERSERFRQFVTNVLASQEPDISVSKFHLSCTLMSVSSGATPVDINSWVSGVVSRSPKELYLQILGVVPVTLLHSVFQCPTLVKLTLDGGTWPWGKIVINLDENIKIHLPKLKLLQLICVNYANDACVTRLFQGCPELEEVVVERNWDSDSVRAYCISGPKLRKVAVLSALLSVIRRNQVSKFGSMQISCPMLEYICLWNYYPHDLSIKCLSGITEAHFHMTPHDSDYAHKLLNIVRGLTSIKYLSFSATTIKAFALLTGDSPTGVLRNNVRLEIGVKNTWTGFSRQKSGPLFRATEYHNVGLHNCEIHPWWMDPKNRPKWLWEHLTELYIYVRDGFFMYIDNVEILMISLREAKSLKRVTIETHREIPSRTQELIIRYIGLKDCSIEFYSKANTFSR